MNLNPKSVQISLQLLSMMDKRTVVPNARFFQNLVSNVVKHNDRREQQKAATNDLLKAKGKY